MASACIYMTLLLTYNVSFKPPLFPDYGILKEFVGTAGHSINSIVTAHDTSSIALPYAGLKCWQISLQNVTHHIHVLRFYSIYKPLLDLVLKQ